jgi:hypothetical protein
MKKLASWVYFTVDFATFVYLTFFDRYTYMVWNWLIAVPINFLLATFGQYIGASFADFIEMRYRSNIVPSNRSLTSGSKRTKMLRIFAG